MSENMNDINHLDTDDVGLSQIFGDRFHDESKTPAAVKTTTRKSTPPQKKNVPAVTEAPKPMAVTPAHESPSPVSNDGWMNKLKSAVHGITGAYETRSMYVSDRNAAAFRRDPETGELLGWTGCSLSLVEV